MPTNDLLTQEEIDALLQEVTTGDLASLEPDTGSAEAETAYQFNIREHIVRGPLPTLEMIYQRFSRHFNSSLFNLLSRQTKVKLANVETMRFADYSAKLPPRCSLHTANAQTLQGVVLFVLDSRLISLFVNGFFGGSTESEVDSTLSDLTVSELRISGLIIRAASADLALSWEPVYKLSLDTKIEATNPYFLNIASPSELIVVARFKIDIGSHQGEMQIAMPYSVIEPIRELLETGMHSDRNNKFTHWQDQLRNSLCEVHLDMKASLAEARLSLGDVLTLKRGDIIPVDVPEQVSLCVAGVPMFRGAFGVSRGRNSIMVAQRQHYEGPRGTVANLASSEG